MRMHMCIQPILAGDMINKQSNSLLFGGIARLEAKMAKRIAPSGHNVLRSRAKRIARLHTPTHIFTCTHLCMYVCIHSYAYLHIYTYKCTCMNTHMCTGHGQHVFTRTHSCVYVRKHT